MLIAIILSAAAVFLPWWSINASPEASALLDSQIKTEYHLLQTMTATKTIENETQVTTISFNNLTENQENLTELSFWFNVAHIITISGLGFSCLMLIMVVLASSGRFFHRYMTLIGYIAAILLFAAPIVLMANFSVAISKLPKLTPVDIPTTWPLVSPKDIGNFWGAIKMQTKFNLPEWTNGGDFWVWGGGAGWYLIFAAALLMFLASAIVRSVVKKETTERHLTAEEKPIFAFLSSLIGGALMFINGLLVGINKGPLILSTSSISSPQEIVNPTSPFWAKVSFGFRGWVEGPWTLVWLIFASIILYCSIKLYMEPLRRKILCFLILLLSILSISCGGGFIIGLVLAVIGGTIGFEWPTPPRETFLGKIIRAARLDTTLYRSFNENPHSLRHATYALILVNILSGLGGGLYAFSTEKIVNAQSLNPAFRILILGEAVLDMSILAPAVINIGLAMLKWITLSLILYLVCTLSLRGKTNLEKIATLVALAYVPVGLQFFTPFMLMSKPYLTLAWPFTIYLFTNLWMILVLIAAMQQVLETSFGKALGIVSLGGAFYLWINQTFFMTLDVPYSIKFFIQPEPVFLAMLACLVLLAMLFGVFKKR